MPGVEIEKREHFEHKFRIFKRQCDAADITSAYFRENMGHFKKPSEIRRVKRKDAKGRWRKKQRENDLPPRKY